MAKVLVVDDVSGVHDMLRTLFATVGIEDDYALSGSEALQKYRDGDYDVVLTDIRMERMDGLALARKLKVYDPAVVVIIMTAFERKDDLLQAIKIGVFDFFVKPFMVNEFTDSVQRAVVQRKRNLIALSNEGVELPSLIKEIPVEVAQEAVADERTASAVQSRAAELEKWSMELEEKEAIVAAEKKALAERESALARKEAEYEQLALAMEMAGSGVSPEDLAGREQALAEKEAALREREAFIEKSENALFEKGQELQELETQLAHQTEISGRGEIPLTQLQELVKKEAILQEWEERLRKKERTLGKTLEMVKAREQYLQTRENILFKEDDD